MARKENPLPTSAGVLAPGARLRVARRQRGLSLGELAARLNYSKPYLSAVENGTARASPAIIAAYATALGIPVAELSAMPGTAATAAAGPAAGTVVTAVDEHLERVAAACGLPPAEAALVRELVAHDAEETAWALRAALDWWREPGPIAVCCVPVAGWQWREWPLPEIIAALDRVAVEAMRARIRELVIVLPPGKSDEIKRAFRRSPFAERLQTVTCVEQFAPLGLGHAILQARAAIGRRPFALSLPDNQFDRLGAAPTVLRQLVDQYADSGDHLVAVAKLPDLPRSYGMARLEPGEDGRSRRGVALLVEKPGFEHPIFRPSPRDSETAYAVVGRYVLAPSVLEALHELSRTQAPGGRLELLDALQWLMDRRRERVAAYVLPAVVRLGPDETIFVAGAPATPGSHVA